MGTSDGSELEELGSGGTGSSLVSGSRVVMMNDEVKVTRTQKQRHSVQSLYFTLNISWDFNNSILTLTSCVLPLSPAIPFAQTVHITDDIPPIVDEATHRQMAHSAKFEICESPGTEEKQYK